MKTVTKILSYIIAILLLGIVIGIVALVNVAIWHVIGMLG